MPLPDFQSLMLPLLQIAGDHIALPLKQAQRILAEQVHLSDEDLAIPVPSGRQSTFTNRVSWAKTHLQAAGLLFTPQPRHFQITARGLDVLSQAPDRINVSYLKQFPEYREFRAREKRFPFFVLEQGDPGVEQEDMGTSEITEPFDPTKIRIHRESPVIYTLIERIRNGELLLTAPFQRQAGLWKDDMQSQLIESLLISIPLPAFYFDGTNEDRWVVVDGLQRLTALKRFVIEKGREQLRLTGMEFLTDLTGQTFDQLRPRLQRRILETQVTAFLIEPGTPENVKYIIFKRINTGGLPLSAQEIRHALNQGPVTDLLSELAQSAEFKKATANRIAGERMADQECVLRFMAFALTDPEKYHKELQLDLFLHQQMAALNTMSAELRQALAARFRRSMRCADQLFGQYAFRKRYHHINRRSPINKALFEAWSVNLDRCSDEQVELLLQRRAELNNGFMTLMADREFERSVSQATGDRANIITRFSRIHGLIQEILT